ncbi:MAG: PAS domain-containing protein [Rhodospirillaceae bacterium]|nr:PAS domain-containing protein [Rhodospirillaceae bacterium]
MAAMFGSRARTTGKIRPRARAGEMRDPFADGRVQRVYDYWRAKRGARPAPGRTDIDPLDLADVLPILNLIDVLPHPPRFRHRVIGTEFISRIGRDITGRFIEEATYGSAAAEIVVTLQRIVDENRPFRRLSRLDWCDRSYLMTESAEMPLIDDDGRVVMIFRATAFFPATSTEGPRLMFEPVP